jgi:nucleoid-associated protein YgaU
MPSFDIVRVESSGAAVIAGVAMPGSMVEVLDADKPVAKTKADESGDWAVELDRPLAPGTHDLAIRATSKGGARVTLSDQRVAVVVPERPTEEPLVVLNTPDAASRIIEMPKSLPSEAAKAEEPGKKPAVPKAAETAPSAGMGSPTLSANPGESQVVLKVVVSTVEADTAGNLFVAGTAMRHDPIRVYLDGALLGETKPTQGGTWLLEVRRELSPGTYKIRADQIDPASGQVMIRAEVPFEREVATLTPIGQPGGPGGASAAGAIPDPQTIIVKRSESLWQISRRMYGNGKRWSTIYLANKEQIRNPRSIFPGQVLTVPAGDMSWKD